MGEERKKGKKRNKKARWTGAAVGRVPGSRLFSPSLPPSLVLSPALTQQNPPTSSATSGMAGYIIAAIIVSQVITAREHPPRCSPSRGGRSGERRNEQRERGNEGERRWRQWGREGRKRAEDRLKRLRTEKAWEEENGERVEVLGSSVRWVFILLNTLLHQHRSCEA